MSTLCDSLDCSPQAPLSMGFPRQKNTRVGCHFLLQGIFPTQGSNPHLHCRQVLYHRATGEDPQHKVCVRHGSGGSTLYFFSKTTWGNLKTTPSRTRSPESKEHTQSLRASASSSGSQVSPLSQHLWASTLSQRLVRRKPWLDQAIWAWTSHISIITLTFNSLVLLLWNTNSSST